MANYVAVRQQIVKASQLLTGSLLILCIVVISQAQIPASSEVEKFDSVVSEVISKAEAHFRYGKLNLEDGKRNQARDEFDKAIDTILESGLDVRASARLHGFYLELVERIYREELPLRTQPRLSDTTRNQPSNAPLGFMEQTFEASPLDELSKLALSADEIRAPESSCRAAQVSDLEIRGLRLGMSQKQTQARFPDLKFTTRNSLGYSSANSSITLRRASQSAAFRGLAYVSLEFLDGGLTDVSFFYDNALKWTNGVQFADKIAQSLKLPKGWVAYKPDQGYKIGQLQVLRCENIQFVAGLMPIRYRDQPVFSWSNLNATQKLALRRREAVEHQNRKEEERRRSFKP